MFIVHTSVNESLDLIECMHNEHVHQILAGSIKPVVERCCSLGKLQMKGVYGFQNLLSLVHALPALLGQCSKTIPLVANLLTSGVDLSTVPVVQGIELLSNGCDLLHPVLVCCQVRLECLMLLLHGLQLKDLAVLVVLAREHLFLARGPGLVNVCLVLELLGQMLESLKTHQLCQQPFLKGLLTAQQSIPSPLDVCDEFSLSWHVGRSVAEPQLE